jgi:hypothetical protein
VGAWWSGRSNRLLGIKGGSRLKDHCALRGIRCRVPINRLMRDAGRLATGHVANPPASYDRRDRLAIFGVLGGAGTLNHRSSSSNTFSMTGFSSLAIFA